MQEKITVINQEIINEIPYVNERYAGFELPIQIDISDIFQQIVTIRTKTKLKQGQLIGVDIQLISEVCSVVGRVCGIKSVGECWEMDVELEYVPVEVVMEFEKYSSIMM